MSNIIQFPKRKLLRSLVIRNYLVNAGYKNVVIFSCGNASRELKRALEGKDINVIDIAPDGVLAPTEKWWTPQEIHKVWPDYFDATSGHIPMRLMCEMAMYINLEPNWLDVFPVAGETYEVPTGSGETILTLACAFPSSKFIPVYNVSAGTKYNEDAPLNFLVDRLIQSQK